MSMLGTVVRGIKTPVIREGDALSEIVTDCVLRAGEEAQIEFRDRDIVAVTEAVVARAQGNYCKTSDIAADVKAKFSADEIGVVFPILSRNRFAICLKGIAMGVKKIYLQLSYPADEVGNHLFDVDLLDEKNVNPYSDVLDEKAYRELFGYEKHPFTGVDYVEYYKELIESCGCEVELVFANQPKAILSYTKNVLACDIHTRARTKRQLLKHGAVQVRTLDEIMTNSINKSGYNEEYGLLGSNKATEELVKLFPRESGAFVEEVAAVLRQKTGKQIEVMVYGDGAFKDPLGKIWELADPVVSPAYTSGLSGQPNELKLKYLADNDFAGLKGKELDDAIRAAILKKDGDLKGSMASQGTTPREIPSLLGSLSDLTSGSGDKGTPVVLIQGYFDNYAK